MENFPNFEQREVFIDECVRNLADREGMNPDDIMSDIVTFTPYEGNETSNPDYLDQVAEMMGITSEEMRLYAIKKAKDFLEE